MSAPGLCRGDPDSSERRKPPNRRCEPDVLEAHLLLLVSSVKLVAEIALLAFAGQWLLGLLAGKKREQNMFYKLLQVVTGPFVKGARFVAPRRIVIDRHLPLVAVLLLAFAWLAATITKISLCLQSGVNLCH